MAGAYAPCHPYTNLKQHNIMRLRTAMLSLFALVGTTVMAQQNINNNGEKIVSPQVNADKTVTFRLLAPKAKSVTVKGDWEVNDGTGKMLKDKNGVWTYTTPALPSEMFTYRFDMDGVVAPDPSDPFTRRDVGNVFSMFFVNGGHADYYQVHDVPHGTVETVWYPSNMPKKNRRMNVYLPPMYGKANRNYPVLYLMHGSGGDENAWLDLGFVNRIMDNLIAEGKVEPMIVVLPNINPSVEAEAGETSDNLSYKPVMTKFLPNYKEGKVEENFPEIVSYVDSHYSTIADKQHRAIAGLSMGGMTSMFVSANYPNLFDYVGLFSAGLDWKGFDWSFPAYKDLDQKLENQKKAGYKLYWIGIGNTDFLYKDNQDFMKKLDNMNFKYTYHESTRGHLWSNWRQYLLIFAVKLFK